MSPARLMAAAALAASGCAQFSPPTGSAGDVGEAPLDCAAAALIEDAEDGDDRTLTRNGRGGYLYTYVDDQGTEITPAGDFAPTEGGPEGSAHAMRMHGTLADAPEVYAGMGFSFMEPKGAYDASQFTGIAFTARRSADSTPAIRIKLPDGHTDPDGGACTDCFNDFGIDVPLTETWTRYEVAFADLKQQPGWGDPRPDAIDPSQLYGVQIQVSQPGAPFDVWVDDISFTGCEAP